MEITSNTAGMVAGVAYATDQEVRDHALVVVMGAFKVARVILADEHGRWWIPRRD
jgi:acetyl/propionyl-CoA carboxylase alpha subunit